MTAANILTIIRMALTPVFAALFLAKRFDLALIVFCAAGFTDMIDGTVARILGQHSEKGAVLDPIADKLLLESAFVLLLIHGVIPLWFFAVAIFRDVMIVGGIFYLERVKIPFPYRAIWSSKLATVMQLAVAFFGLWISWRGELNASLLHYLIIFTTALILISGVQYVLIGAKILKSHSKLTNPRGI